MEEQCLRIRGGQAGEAPDRRLEAAVVVHDAGARDASVGPFVQNEREPAHRDGVDVRVGVEEEHVGAAPAAPAGVAAVREPEIRVEGNSRHRKVCHARQAAISRRIVDDDHLDVLGTAERLDAASQRVAAVVRDDDDVDGAHGAQASSVSSPALAPEALAYRRMVALFSGR